MSDTLQLLKELPPKAIPFVIFLFATAVFGEIYIRMHVNSSFDEVIHKSVGVLMLVAACMFFTKCFFNVPPMKGLDLPHDHPRRRR